MVSFAKLDDGSWGIRGPVDEIKLGGVATVTKRNGAIKTVAVTRIIHEANGTVVAAIGGSAGRETRESRPRREPRARVHTYRFGGEDSQEYIRNVNGRCIDAPCCGCCTI